MTPVSDQPAAGPPPPSCSQPHPRARKCPDTSWAAADSAARRRWNGRRRKERARVRVCERREAVERAPHSVKNGSKVKNENLSQLDVKSIRTFDPFPPPKKTGKTPSARERVIDARLSYLTRRRNGAARRSLRAPDVWRRRRLRRPLWWRLRQLRRLRCPHDPSGDCVCTRSWRTWPRWPAALAAGILFYVRPARSGIANILVPEHNKQLAQPLARSCSLARRRRIAEDASRSWPPAEFALVVQATWRRAARWTRRATLAAPPRT